MMEPQAQTLPEGWMETTLGAVAKDIVGGGTPSKRIEEHFQGKIPFMTVKDMTVSRPKDTIDHITEKALRESSAKLIPADTIIIATRMGLGKVVRTAFKTAINQDLKAIFPHDGVEKDFLEYWLRSMAVYLESRGTGTTVKGLRLELIRGLRFPLAPLNEQKRIVDKIETLFSDLDKGEENLRTAQRLIASYRQSVMKAAMSGELIGADSGTWKTCPLGEMITDIRYGTAKKCQPDPSKTPVLRIPNVVSGKIDLSDLKHTDFEPAEIKKLTLKEGDVLLVRSNGSASLVGRSAVVTKEAEGYAYAGYLIRLRLKQDRILPQFLHLYLHSPHTRAHIERQARSTSGVHNINSDEVKSLALRLPPIADQMAILDKVEDIFSQIAALEAWCATELARSATLRQAILKSAFSGQLVPQDASDEPASELLKRIQTERACAPKAKPAAKRGRPGKRRAA